MSTPANLHSRPQLAIADCVVWNDVGGELVLYNSDDGTYHALNEVGSHVWRSLAAGHRVVGILLALHKTYQQEPAAIDEAVEHFIGQALATGLLVASGDA